MKFVCPVCKTAGDIPEHDTKPPATQATCHKCGSGLRIEHETGRVEALTEKRHATTREDSPGRQPQYDTTPVLSMGKQDKGKKDYLAVGAFAVILSALIATGVYFTLNLNRGVLNQPLQVISELVDDFARYGKSIWGEFQKDRQPQNKQDRQARKRLRKGYDHYKANRLKKALEELSLAIETDPQNVEAHFWRARTYIRLEQFDNAIADLKKVVDLDPRYSRAYDNLGWLFMRRNKYDQSLAHLNKSIELKPDNGWAHYMRGRVFFNKGDFQKAFENASAACKLGYKDACRDARRYESKLSPNS